MSLFELNRASSGRRHVFLDSSGPRTAGRTLASMGCVVLSVWLAACGRGDEKLPQVPAEPRSAAQARPATADFVIGNLGGSPVRIPSYYVEGRDYGGDPSFGVARDGPPPVRTIDSRLRTISLMVRYPDMAGLSTPELKQDQRSFHAGNTPWMRIMIQTGEHYYPNGLDNIYAARNAGKKYTFQVAREPFHGLRRYVPVGADPELRKAPSFSAHAHDRDIFVDFRPDNRVRTYILCSNLLTSSAPCRHEFDLSPDLQATASILYRRDLLTQWQHIQSLTHELILSFRVQ